jgi:Domain of unknown function (DUF4397)
MTKHPAASRQRGTTIHRVRRAGRLLTAGLLALAALALAGGAPALAAPAAGQRAAHASAAARAQTGWVRLANLSPGAPTYDIYLYPVGNMHATLVLRSISYGMVSGYQMVAAGGYTVALRMVGKSASSVPVLSGTVSVGAGQAFTIASVGPSSAPRLEVLSDMLTAPKGQASVRIIQAALQQSRITVTAGGYTLVRGLAFGDATSFATVDPGTWELHASGSTMSASQRETWSAGTTYTLVILDGTGGQLELEGLMDGAASKVQPSGAAPMGFGGTAPRPPASPLPWLAGMAGGGALAAGGALWLRRTRAVA